VPAKQSGACKHAPYQEMNMRLFLIALVVATAAASTSAVEPAADDTAQAARDAQIVEAVKRLKGFDLNSSAKAKAAVLRHMRRRAGTPEFLELAEQFKLRDAAPELIDLAIAKPTDTLGVDAARLALQFGAAETIRKRIAASEEKAATALVTALGLAGGKESREILTPLLAEPNVAAPVRIAAARALGRSNAGQRELLALVKSGRLPAALRYTVGSLLHASNDPQIRAEVAKHIEPPKTKNAKPLPPLAELVGRRGDPYRGRQVFFKEGTCIKCHKVGGEGKEVGPDLSEIGGKLSREALYTSILDPSAGISHNYETHALVLEDGETPTGIIVSQTDEAITLKNAEAIVRTYPRDQIEQIIKQNVSIMPADLQQNLTVEQLVDLVEYLTTLRPKAAG